MTGAANGAPGPRRPAYRRLTVEERRAQLLDVAATLFAHRPPEDVSLDDVAAAAGASRPLVYRYFPGGKQQVYEAVLRAAADGLAARIAAPPAAGSAEDSGPLARLAASLGAYLAFVDGNDTGYAALMRGGRPVAAAGGRAEDVVEGVRRAARAEVERPLVAPGEEASPRLRLAVRSWTAAVEVAALGWLEDGRRPAAEELAEWLLEQFCATLAAAAASDPASRAALARLAAAEPPGGPGAERLRRWTGAGYPTAAS